MNEYKKEYFEKKDSNNIDFRLHHTFNMFPWEEWTLDQDYAMPYPEIIALSDHAHALYTQISGMLLDFSYSKKNKGEVKIYFDTENSNEKIDKYVIEVSATLGEIDEVWQAINISDEQLIRYTKLMIRNYYLEQLKQDFDFTYQKINENKHIISISR